MSYTLDGLVKQAGKNLILDIGKLIGTQWQPNELDEKRQVDAYLPTAMQLNHTHAYVPVAGWKEMLAIAKKANDFQGRSVVLSPL